MATTPKTSMSSTGTAIAASTIACPDSPDIPRRRTRRFHLRTTAEPLLSHARGRVELDVAASEPREDQRVAPGGSDRDGLAVVGGRDIECVAGASETGGQ